MARDVSMSRGSVLLIPRTTNGNETKVTTNIDRVIEVLEEDPIAAMSKGRNTIDGIERKKLMVPFVTLSPEFQSEIEIPITSARIVPTKNPVKEIPIVTLKDFQNSTERISGIKSLSTLHECGKFPEFARADALSHKRKLMIGKAIHLLGYKERRIE
jgi:hypothetical protein